MKGLGKAVVRDVHLSENSVTLTVEAEIGGGRKYLFTLTVTYSDWILWQQENPSGTFLDFITEKTKERVTTAIETWKLAVGLKGKTLSW